MKLKWIATAVLAIVMVGVIAAAMAMDRNLIRLASTQSAEQPTQLTVDTTEPPETQTDTPDTPETTEAEEPSEAPTTEPAVPETTGVPETVDTPETTTPPEQTEPSEPESEEPAYLTYEAYQAMGSAEQMAYMNSFPSIDAFFAWYNSAKAQYEAENPPIDVGDGNVDMEDFM